MVHPEDTGEMDRVNLAGFGQQTHVRRNVVAVAQPRFRKAQPAGPPARYVASAAHPGKHFAKQDLRKGGIVVLPGCHSRRDAGGERLRFASSMARFLI